MLTVLEPGSKVTIGCDNTICATIVEVHIGPNYAVEYTCNWFNGRAFCSQTLKQFEVQPASPTAEMKIGFHNNHGVHNEVAD